MAQKTFKLNNSGTEIVVDFTLRKDKDSALTAQELENNMLSAYTIIYYDNTFAEELKSIKDKYEAPYLDAQNEVENYIQSKIDALTELVDTKKNEIKSIIDDFNKRLTDIENKINSDDDSNNS